MGKGTFLIEIYKRLVNIYGYSPENAKSRIYGYDVRVKYVNHLQRRGFINVRHKDFLKEIFKMKFDVVLGNPPYQKQVGPKKTEAIWPKFVEKSFEICKEGGYVSLIHPSGWRDVKGNFSYIKDLLKSKNIKYLNVNDFNTGKEIFGVGTNFDWYVIENSENKNGVTEINTVDNEVSKFNTNNINYIPNGMINTYDMLVAKESEDVVELLHSYSCYEIRNEYMSKQSDNHHIYPIVYSITQKDGIKLMYSKINKGHIGIPKIIWSNGLGTYPIIDVNGEYGLTQFAYGIVDTLENLPFIKKVMESNIFIKFMSYVKFTNNKYHYKIISTFKKDFWKYFLDEDNNVIEPNFENVERI
jgi:predicted RNA methylase